MSEPITLYNRDGETLTVYTRSQAAERLAGGEWYASQSDAEAGKGREEATPAAKLAALEGDAAAVTRQESATPAPQPEPQPEPEAAPAKRPAKGKTPS